ncbi:MAG TPA: MotA/TolQ/ExbB proton channel family protein, partial [Opitutaceae bacterium]
RRKIADEKAPLLAALHAAEERIVAAESEIARIETEQEERKDRKRQLQKEREPLLKNLGYASTLAHDAVAAIGDGLAPGEAQAIGPRLKEIIEELGATTKSASEQPTADALELMLHRVERSVGGYQMRGRAIVINRNEVEDGTYAFVGPDAFFRSADGKFSGVLRTREGAVYPIVYPLDNWKPADADAFFQGRRGTVMADATSGKALRLQETTGTLVEHLKRGGAVSLVIITVGLLSVILILNKIFDLVKLKVDEPGKVEVFLSTLPNTPAERRWELLRPLRPVTRELFATGLKHIDDPKSQLEERLFAVLMRIRLHSERRLPLLAVIAVAAPLMGLLGTVTGMVRTFALITVFGTGNAGKLASGISEVLIATELGLLVAIPTLVAHGFLASRIQKKLLLLERYSLEFTTAAQSAKRPVEVL